MKAVLYVGHGSRVASGNQQLLTFIENVKRKIFIPIQETAFLEKAEPTIQQGIESCMNKGATSIAIIPVLLLAAGHVENDLPFEIEQAKKRHPLVNFTYGRPIGSDISVVDMLIGRLKENGFAHNDFNKREEITVLLVGRGSSDVQANSDLVKIARMLWELCPVETVDYCFLAATRPNFQEGLEKAVKNNSSKIYVIPYLLFTGVLMKRMERTISEFRETSDKNIVLTNYLGYHPKLVDIIADRTKEALENNQFMSCDSCSYRLTTKGRV